MRFDESGKHVGQAFEPDRNHLGQAFQPDGLESLTHACFVPTESIARRTGSETAANPLRFPAFES